MARVTDRIKRNIAQDPLRKYKEAQEAPNWLSGAGIWVGVAAVVAAIGFLIFTGITSDGPSDTVADPAPDRAPQIEVNPHETEEAGSGETPSSNDTPPASDGGGDDTTPANPDEIRSANFKALESVSMPVETSSLDSPVPEGAVNVAKAGALSMTSGDWSDVPTNRSPNDDRYLGVTVDYDSMRLTDPVGAEADANKAFTFLFDGVDADGTEVQFTVTAKWSDDSYQVINF